MFIDHVKLENYRNYSSLDIQLSNDVNIFYGNNGQGKTNLLEAVFYSVIGKSFRGTKDSDIIMSGKNEFLIDISVNEVTIQSLKWSLEIAFKRMLLYF